MAAAASDDSTALLLTPRWLVVARVAVASAANDRELARSSAFSPALSRAVLTAAGGSRSMAATLRSTDCGSGGSAVPAFVAVATGMDAAGALPVLSVASTLEPGSVGLTRSITSVLPAGSHAMSPTARWR
jgi:hypothetical protein